MKIEKKETGWWLEVTTEGGGYGIPICDNDYEDLKKHFLEEYKSQENKWVDVKTRLPGFNIQVLVFCKIYGRFLASYDRIDDTNWGNWRYNDELGILPPTHWMPLPEAPTK